MFLDGPAGAGKTTAAIARINALIEKGVHADEILLLVPQRSYTIPYEEALGAAIWYRLGKGTLGGMVLLTEEVQEVFTKRCGVKGRILRQMDVSQLSQESGSPVIWIRSGDGLTKSTRH